MAPAPARHLGAPTAPRVMIYRVAKKAPEPEAELDEVDRELFRRRRSAQRAGLGPIDADLFAVGDTPTAILLLCKRRGATPDQIRRICV